MAEQDKDTALFGECKWRNEKLDTEVLDALILKSELFPHKNKFYYLFSKSGFTKGCTEKAEKLGNVILVDFKNIMNDIKNDAGNGR